MSSDIFELDQGDRETLRGTLHDPQATAGYVLTVQADKSIAAKPGGGGSGGVQVVTVPVSSAQILDLFNTPVVLIPGVAGSIIVVTTAVISYLAGIVPYLDGGGNILVTDSCGNKVVQVAGVGLWDQPTNEISYELATLFNGTFGGGGVDATLSVNVGNPTLGDGTLLVTVSYFLAPTV